MDFVAQEARQLGAEIEGLQNTEPTAAFILQQQSYAQIEAPIKKFTSSCGMATSSTIPVLEYTPPKSSKIGNQVYVFNKGEDEIICFEDASVNQHQISVSHGEGFNFIGQPPFKIVSTRLNQFDMYYQGYKVKLGLDGQAIILQEAKIQ